MEGSGDCHCPNSSERRLETNSNVCSALDVSCDEGGEHSVVICYEIDADASRAEEGVAHCVAADEVVVLGRGVAGVGEGVDIYRVVDFVELLERQPFEVDDVGADDFKFV